MDKLTVIFFSSWKFAATFPVAVFALKMSFYDTLLYTNIGAILGIIVFSFLSEGLIKLVNFFLKKIGDVRKPKKVFSKFNRRLVYIKSKFGLPGIVVLTPILLSIPVGAFLVTKYYHHHKRNYLYLVAGHFVWSLAYIFIYSQVLSVFRP
jgi:hypothetical protein